MNILGISCYYHDAAAAISVDGKIIAASQEERFSRKKHDSSFPKNAIDFCLNYSGLKKKDIDFAVFYEKPFTKLNRILISSLSTFPFSHASFREAARIMFSQKLWIKQDIASFLDILPQNIRFCSHHISHASGCFYPSLFKKAAILTADGVGEWTTTSYGIGENEKIRLLGKLHFPQSLGLLYSAFTAFLGHQVNDGEWKVMGLAPYGKPMFFEKIMKLVKLNDDGSFNINMSYFSYHYSESKSYNKKFINLFGPPVNPKMAHLVTEFSANIAASIQKACEIILLNMASNLHKKTGLENLCFSGGVALNSVANYKLLKKSGFKNIYINPAPGDDGGAVGAALFMHHHVLNNKKRYLMENAYLGKKYSNEEIKKYLDINKIKYKYYSDEKLKKIMADKLNRGLIGAILKGRFEWGPRALGSRSIIADPRNAQMKDIINAKVKYREAFRPFAPSVMAEKAPLIFDIPKNHSKYFPLRFMLYVIPVKNSWRKKIAAVNHADNTARPQLVYPKDNPFYYDLINEFYRITKVPLILNTSFNLKGEPIVNSPSDAYSTFQRSDIDFLVLENYLVEK